MKAQFLKMAGVNSEDEFYNMFPTEESFFQAYPEARTYANGGATYPYPGQATADQFFNYGMQGKGAGAQIPVETWFAYGGFTSKPSATLVHYEDGGMGQHSSPFNYGAFPAFAKKGNQVQGGGIDAATGTIKDNFLAVIQKNNQLALNKQAAEQAMEIAPQVMPELLYPAFQNGGSNLNAFTSAYEDIRQDRANKMEDFMGSVAGAVSYETDKRIKQNMYDEFNKKLNELIAKQKQFDPMKDAQTTSAFNPVPENMAKLGGSLKKFQGGGKTDPDTKVLAQNKYVTNTQNIINRQKLIQQMESALLEAEKAEAEKQRRYKEAEDFGQKTKPSVKEYSGYTYIDKKDWNSAEPGQSKKLKSSAELKAAIAAEKQKIETAKADLKKVTTTYPQYYPKDSYPDLYQSDNPWGFVITEEGKIEDKKEAPKENAKTQGPTPATTGTKPGQRYVPGTTPVTSTTPKTTTGTAPKTTGTPATTGGGDPVEAAVKQLATAYGVDPDQTWQNYQSIMSAYGTRGAGTGYPSYFTTGDDYRYRGRGKGAPFVRDIGYMPTPQDIQAMQAQASQMGYGLKVTEKPRFLGFGPKKIIIETTFNPNTGKVEETPKVVDETPAPTLPTTNNEPVTEDFTVPRLEVAEGFRQGGLMRFLPKHDMLGQTGGYEGKPVNSIFDTLSDIQDSDMTGTAGIPGVTGKKTGSKGVYKQKIQTPPWMADTMLTGIGALSSMASGDEEERARQEMTQRMRGDYVFGTSGGKDVGTYVPTGALTGVLSPNLYNPAVDTGYMGGFKKDRGGSVAYSDWSQTPVNGYYGTPTGEMTMYPHWTQAPVMQKGGTPIHYTSEEQYRAGLLNKNKSAEQIAAEREWVAKRAAKAQSAKTTATPKTTAPYKQMPSDATATSAPQKAALKQQYNKAEKLKEEQRLAEINARKQNLSPESYSTYNWAVNIERGPVLQNGVDTRYGDLLLQDTIPVKGTMSDYGGTSQETIFFPNFERFGQVLYSMPNVGLYGYIPSGSYARNYSPYDYGFRKEGGAIMQDGVYDLSEDEINAIIQAGGQVEFLD